ncbi:MAG: ParM/StbA family protein [Anaerolineae bacterium]|nr:ParM/StbA family protein [Anaerolineae bacterium]
MTAVVIRKVAIDNGFGGYKVAEVQTSGQVRVEVIPAVVGIGKTDTGLLATGLKRQRSSEKPLTVNFGHNSYLVGHNVHLSARPLERLDFQRLSEGPELLAWTYAGLWKILGSGDHKVILLDGLPVEILQNEEQAQAMVKRLRTRLVGDHSFRVNGQLVILQILQVRAIAQPVGSYFAWGLDTNGNWVQHNDSLKAPVAVADFGFNTLDLFVVQNGQVVGRFTAGKTLGMRRANSTIRAAAREQLGVDMSLHEADELVKMAVAGQPPLVYHPGGEMDFTDVVRQALEATFAEAITFIEEQWGNTRQFRHLLLTGGGAQALREFLLRQYPHALILPNPVTANAEGLAKFAVRTKAVGQSANGVASKPV